MCIASLSLLALSYMSRDHCRYSPAMPHSWVWSSLSLHVGQDLKISYGSVNLEDLKKVGLTIKFYISEWYLISLNLEIRDNVKFEDHNHRIRTQNTQNSEVRIHF